jgi:phosphoglycerate dehydrogenase-like enzyme
MQPGDKITFWLLLLVLPPAMALLLWWSGLQFGSRHFLWLLLAVPPALALFFWWGERVRQKLLTQFVEARLLASLTVGLSLTRRKIRYALVLASVRQFPYFAAEQAAGRWSFRFTGCLAGKTVLIVGYGSIGAAVERRLSGFDVRMLRVARTARDGVAAVVGIPDLLPQADVVILLAPVTAQTTGMADAAFLARMKDGALLVNAARGSLLRTDALCAELQSGRLHAALDVTDPEPLEPGHPLWDMPNVLITPHVAASTPVSASTAVSFVREQAQRFLTGQPLENVITGEY